MQAVTQSNGQPAFRSRWLFITNGLYYIVTALGLAVGCYMMPSFPQMIVDSGMADLDDLPSAVAWMMNHRMAISLTGLPLLACGIILTTTSRLKWLWTIVGLFASIVPLAVVMYCFIAAMAVLYDPPPL